MKIKKQDMKITGFLDDTSIKKFHSKVVETDALKGVVGIIKWLDVKEKVEVHYNFKDEVIVDSNYTWIQVAPFDSNYWIKAMYDENNNLVEIYIDVTKENHFDDITNPSYEDLFLDVVVPSKGHIYQMDDVELMRAYNEKLISEKEYKMAKVVCKKLIQFLNEHHQEFLDFMRKLKQELEFELNQKQ
ncbi:MAG: DUF402 domain-containing protein [Bacilli bacterium]|nr:DUF402 domain-containing protein [Bacilli bacterium]